jgi:hypothetical protein
MVPSLSHPATADDFEWYESEGPGDDKPILLPGARAANNLKGELSRTQLRCAHHH